MLLVIHHVFQTLVKHRSNEYRCLHLLSRKTVIHDFIAITLVPGLLQFLGNRLDVEIAETRSVAEYS